MSSAGMSSSSLGSAAPPFSVTPQPSLTTVPSGRNTPELTQLSRLLHHLQRERGASCAWVSSGGTNEYFDLRRFRSLTDETRPPEPFAERISGVRATVDGAATQPAAPHATDFYAVFAHFCAMCEELLVEQESRLAKAGPESATLCTFSRLKEVAPPARPSAGRAVPLGAHR